MKIIVCVKIVIDPEAPASLFKVDPEAKKVIPPKGTPPVLNPFDENALEAALRIKDSCGASITILSMGRNIPKPIIRKSLATGADSLILLDDEAFESLDSYATAYVLADAIKKIGDFDIILAGREAADTDAGQVGLGIAEILAIPSVSLASRVIIEEGKLKVERVTSSGYETVEVLAPALVTVSSELGSLRTASMANIIASQKKPMTVWASNDFLTCQARSKLKLINLIQPARNTECNFISGETPEDAGSRLAQTLRGSGAF